MRFVLTLCTLMLASACDEPITGMDAGGDGGVEIRDAGPPRSDGGPGCSAVSENTPATCGDGCDNDGDGFTDCDDFGCSNVGSCACAQRAEINQLCADGCSNDGDALIDCADPDCTAACADGGVECTAGPENTPAACSDGCSNDGNTFVDCDDWSCSNVGPCACARRAESNFRLCADGCSNDDDALIDCADPDCATACTLDGGVCSVEPETTPAACGDGCSNDGDPFVDCDDFSCSNLGGCPCAAIQERGVACRDGCDNDGDGQTDCADAECADACGLDGGMPCPAQAERTDALCGDGCDNDGDGQTDCADDECSNLGACPCDTPFENTPITCSDGCSNDGDLLADCREPDCNGIAGCVLCVRDCAGRSCGSDGCGGSCGTCTAPAACNSAGSCVAACPSGAETATLCGDGCDNDGDGQVDCDDIGCASMGSCSIASVTVDDVTLAQLRLIRPALDFGNLTITGTLSLPADSSSAVTITGARIDISRIDMVYPGCLRSDRDGTDVTLRATELVRLGSADLHGEAGDDESATTSCADCYGGDGGNLTVEAPQIRVNGFVWLDGGGGRTYVDDLGPPSQGYGCDGGDAGDLVLRSTTSLVTDGWSLSMSGGDEGNGRGEYRPDGDRGVDGSLTLAGASITLGEVDRGYFGNASFLNTIALPYQTLDIHGTVSRSDDERFRTNDYGLFAEFGGGTRDFIEDLHEIRVTAAATLRITLSFASSDLDLYLINAARTMYLASSNGLSSPEALTYAVSPGTYYIGVSFSDDAAPVTTPVPYTLQLR